MAKILLKQATVLTKDGFRMTEVLVDGPYIAKIAPEISEANAIEINCAGMLVLPGLIDAHVHFRQPGMESKATIYSESRAAALGGVTSFMDMPNTNPPTTTIAALNSKMELAQRDSLVNYGFYLGANDSNVEEVKRVDPKTVAGIKVYMGSTTGNLLLDDNSKLHQIFAAAPTLVATHCEDNAIIDANTRRAKDMYGDEIPFSMHPIIRSRDCCIQSTKLAMQVALDTKARLHVMHLSTQEEVEMMRPFAKGDLFEREITAEVCIPHLYFNESDYSRLKGFLKCNPAVKFERDRRALVNAVRSGVISTIGTDHAPHEIEQKNSSNYLKVASGLPSVQFSLPVIFDLFKRGEISLEEGIRAATINVAKRFGIEKRGEIAEGNYADMVILDPRSPQNVHVDDIVSLCKWSPFTGSSFRSQVHSTIASGRLVVSNGKLCEVDESAMALRFASKTR